MKFLYLCIGIFAVSLCSAQQGTVKSQIVTQTSSSPGQTTVAPTAGTTTGTATPLTAVTTQTAGSIVGGTNATAATTPTLQNLTNIFGQIVGVMTNFGTTTGASAGQSAGTGGGLTAQQGVSGVGAPGFTQIMITLQGTVQSESDRQAILNRFQGLSGFTVVDQMQVAGSPGSNVNEAAGAATPIRSSLTNPIVQP